MPSLLRTAIKLLEACNPPNNHALYELIRHHAAQLDQEQRRAALQLVTWPVRENADRLGDMLAWIAIKHFPDAVEVQHLWSRWITAGVFDGNPSSPADLARYLADPSNKACPHAGLRSSL